MSSIYQQLGDGAVVVGKKRKKTSEPVAAPVVEEPVLSKNQRRKLESLKVILPFTADECLNFVTLCMAYAAET